MTVENIIQELTPIFIDLFDEEDLSISGETNADDIEDWDSLTHVHLIVLIEGKFDVKFTSTEIGAFNKVGDIIDSIISKKA